MRVGKRSWVVVTRSGYVGRVSHCDCCDCDGGCDFNVSGHGHKDIVVGEAEGGEEEEGDESKEAAGMHSERWGVEEENVR